jgi:hypothetical protein
MYWDVKTVQLSGPLSFTVQFEDGLTGKVQFEESHLTGVFESLKDPVAFQQISIQGGAVTWPGDLDLAPDVMYAEIKAKGEWVLR